MLIVLTSVCAAAAATSQGSGMSDEGRNLIRKLESDHTQITPRI
jgi:hypothetical protein